MIVDSKGRRWPVHADILRLRFPLFRHIDEIQTVVMSEASPGEVELLLGLAYGGDRFSTFAESIVLPSLSLHPPLLETRFPPET